MDDEIDSMIHDASNPEYARSMAAKLDHDIGVVMPDDAIFRALADGYPMHMMWRMSLPTMWDDVAQTLGRRVTFMTSEQREAAR